MVKSTLLPKIILISSHMAKPGKSLYEAVFPAGTTVAGCNSDRTTMSVSTVANLGISKVMSTPKLVGLLGPMMMSSTKKGVVLAQFLGRKALQYSNSCGSEVSTVRRGAAVPMSDDKTDLSGMGKFFY